MAIDNTTYRVRIKSEYDGQGTEDAKKGFAELNQNISFAGISAQDFGEKGKEAGHKVELSHHELKEAVHAVAREFGGLADVGLWLSPQLAALAAVTLAVDKLKEHFSELSAQILEAATVSQQIRADHLAAVGDAARSTAAAMEDYARAARSAAEAQDRETQATEDQLALNAAYLDGLKQIAEAKERAYEQQVDQDVATGQISQQEGERRKHAAEERMASYSAELDAQKEQARITADQDRLQEARGRIPQEKAARDKALHEAEHPSVTGSDVQKEIERQQAVLDAQNKKVAAAKAEVTEFGRHGSAANIEGGVEDFFAGKPTGTMAKARIALDQRQAAEDQKLADQTTEYIETLKNKKDAAEKSVKDAKAESEVQNKKIQQDEELTRTLPERIQQEKDLAAIHQHTAQGVQGAQVQGHQASEGTARAQEARRARAGRATAADLQQQADEATYRYYSTEGGPQSSLDARSAVDEARTVMANAHGQNAAGQEALLPEMLAVIKEMSALLANRNVSGSTHNELMQEIQKMKANIQQLYNWRSVTGVSNGW